MEIVEEARDGLGDFVGGATVADRPSNGGELPNTATDAEIVGVDHFAAGLDFFALDADVGDPVLAAGVGAAGDVQAKVVLIVGKSLFEFFAEPAGEGFGFGE